MLLAVLYFVLRLLLRLAPEGKARWREAEILVLRPQVKVVPQGEPRVSATHGPGDRPADRQMAKDNPRWGYMRIKGKLEAAERALAAKPDREQAQELVDLLPLLDVDAALLAEASFRELLAALDSRATFHPHRNELGVRAVLAPKLVPPNGSGTSSLSSVHPAGQYSKKCPQVEGHVFQLSARHAKVRRKGYRSGGKGRPRTSHSS